MLLQMIHSDVVGKSLFVLKAAKQISDTIINNMDMVSHDVSWLHVCTAPAQPHVQSHLTRRSYRAAKVNEEEEAHTVLYCAALQ